MNAIHPLLDTIKWRDLVPLTRCEIAGELFLSLPWRAASWVCYEAGWWWLGLPCSFYFFLTGLRPSHNAQHYALGLPRFAQDALLLALSTLMLASMHAVQATHLHHHRCCLNNEDTEGAVARMKWWQAVALGPLFPLRLLAAAWRLTRTGKRSWIVMELMAIVGVIFCAITLDNATALRWHFGAMLVGECLTGFFAVWTVHHDCDEPPCLARTQRGRWLNRLTYGMFYHQEHHLFPAIPTPHLPELARRLDVAMPGLCCRHVIE